MLLMKIVLLMLTIVAVSSKRFSRQLRSRDDSDTFQTLPRRALAKPGGSLTIVGNAGVPLQSCLFYLPYPRSKWAIDLSQGHKSNSSDPSRYEYFGRGLEFGDCGMRFKRIGDDDDGIIQCEVLAVGSEGPDSWEKCATTLRVTNIRETELPVFDIEPSRNLIHLARGEDITITCNADRPLNLCHIYLPGPVFLNLDRGVDTPVTKQYRYHGEGLDKGECGATLTGVDTTLTGYVVCKVGSWPESLNGKWETDSFQVVTKEFITTPIDNNPIEVPLKNPNATSCPPLGSKSVNIRCVYGGKSTLCSQPQKIRSEAYMDCKPGYTIPSRINYRKIRCMKGGIWEPRPITCQPDCGKRITNDGVPTLANALDTMIGEFPWHVGIYQLVNNKPVQVCGGSLVAPGLVVSAAHCFWDNNRQAKIHPSQYKVAAGKHNRLWKTVHNRAQRRDVLEIIVPKDYRGRPTNFNADVALVRLKKPFRITSVVNLICVDWNHDFDHKHLKQGNTGIVTGWGFTENNVQSDVLQYLGLPYQTRDTCLLTLRDEVQQLLTEDKFCAGFINGSKSVCRGDSGGGLVFREPTNKKHYLRGVVSIAFISHEEGVCNIQDYTGFTKFDQYHDWVLDNLYYDYSKVTNNEVSNDKIVFPQT